MITVISGIRELHPSSYADVELAVLDETDIATTMRFGGALGVDTVALRAAGPSEIRKSVFVPFRVRDQPEAAREAIENCANDIVELRFAKHSSAYLRRNDAMLDGADRLLAFTDGRDTGGTAYTIREAKKRNIETIIVPVLSAQSRIENPARTVGQHSVFSYRSYVSIIHGYDWTSDVIRRLKDNQVGPADLNKLARRIAHFIEGEPMLATAEALVAMPRRLPQTPSDMNHLAQVIANLTGKKALRDHLVRTDEPTGGTLRARRLRFPAEEHMRTLKMKAIPSIRSVIVLDNVWTYGGTMTGALRAIARDQPNIHAVGLAILTSKAAQ